MAWAELSDCRCCFELLGHGEPLILIPGLGATCKTFETVLPELSQFFTVITFDNRGVGRSLARRQPSTLCDLVSDVIELCDHLQLDRVHVLGVSLGGIIAQRLAIDHPSRVDRLVLVSCADAFSPYLRQMTLLLAHSLRRLPKEMFVRTLELLGTAPEFMDANMKLVEERVASKISAQVSPRSVGRQLRCLASAEVPEHLYRIFAPTLVVAGEYDPIIPNCYSRRMAEKIPGSEYVMIRGGGHNPLLDHPEAALPRIIRFLRAEVEGRTGHALWKDATGSYYGEGSPSMEMAQGGSGMS